MGVRHTAASRNQRSTSNQGPHQHLSGTPPVRWRPLPRTLQPGPAFPPAKHNPKAGGIMRGNPFNKRWTHQTADPSFHVRRLQMPISNAVARSSAESGPWSPRRSGSFVQPQREYSKAPATKTRHSDNSMTLCIQEGVTALDRERHRFAVTPLQQSRQIHAADFMQSAFRFVYVWNSRSIRWGCQEPVPLDADTPGRELRPGRLSSLLPTLATARPVASLHIMGRQTRQFRIPAWQQGARQMTADVP